MFFSFSSFVTKNNNSLLVHLLQKKNLTLGKVSPRGRCAVCKQAYVCGFTHNLTFIASFFGSRWRAQCPKCSPQVTQNYSDSVEFCTGIKEILCEIFIAFSGFFRGDHAKTTHFRAA